MACPRQVSPGFEAVYSRPQSMFPRILTSRSRCSRKRFAPDLNFPSVNLPPPNPYRPFKNWQEQPAHARENFIAPPASKLADLPGCSETSLPNSLPLLLVGTPNRSLPPSCLDLFGSKAA